jgi:hypothetical protein
MAQHLAVRVTEVEVLHDRVVPVQFDDDTTAERDLGPLLRCPSGSSCRGGGGPLPSVVPVRAPLRS